MTIAARAFDRSRRPLTWALAALLAACAGAPRVGLRGGDGPGANPPPNLASTPDAEPRIEPVRSGGPNRPYEVFGRPYVPLGDADPALRERGLASWYGRKFHGRPTSSGEPYDMYAMTAAHKTMPIPSYARVRNPANGREVIVRVNDRGPFHAGRVIDLSYTAALKLGVLNAVAPVEVERITHEAIRTGAWRGDAAQRAALAAAAPPALRPPSATLTSGADGTVTPPPTQPTPGPAALAATATVGDSPAAAAPEAAAALVDAVETGQRPGPVPIASSAPGFWMQLGAFRERDGALDFQRKVERELDWLAPLLAVFVDRELHRLQAGPYASRTEAAGAAERLRAALQLVPMIVERR